MYYFISFMYGASEKTLHNVVIEGCPLTWQRHANEKYPGQYVLNNWIKISHKQYNDYAKGF